MDKNYSGIGIVVVILIVLAAIALAVPGLIFTGHRGSSVTGAQYTLKSLVSTEDTWMNTDTDRNGIKDYWTADLSGFYRVLDASGNSVWNIDISFARADWNPVSAGGSSPVAGVSLVPSGTPVPKSGYYYAAFVNDEHGKPYAQDLNGDGFAYENANHYAFQTFPDRYGTSGKLAFIMNESGVVYKIEAIAPETGMNTGKSFNDPKTSLPSTAAPSVPMPYWPATNPIVAGYSEVVE